jgi:hypothetical protein
MCHISELTELPLGEASSTTMRSKSRQWYASGSLHHPYSPCIVGTSFTNEVPKRVEAAYPQSSPRSSYQEALVSAEQVPTATLFP